MGQISQAFDHIVDNKEIKELSVVLYADSFFCGFWTGLGELLKCEFLSVSDFNSRFSEWKNEFPGISVNVVSTTMPYVHIAEDMYNSKHFEQFFKGMYDLRKCKRKLKELDYFVSEPIYTLHYLDKKLIESLKEIGIPFKISHISTSMSNYLSIHNCNLIVYIQDNKLHIASHKQDNFIFYNQFICADVNDYLYFILLVLQSFEIDYQDEEIHLGGEIDRTSKLYTRLRSHLPTLMVIDDLFSTRESLESPKQVYFDLYLSQSCVS